MTDVVTLITQIEASRSAPGWPQFMGLRLFCAHCHVLDNGDRRVVAALEAFGESREGERRLVQLHDSLVAEVKDWASRIGKDFDHDGYYQAESWMQPLIDVCNPRINWHALCEKARYYARRSAYRDTTVATPDFLTELLRRCLATFTES